METFGKKLLDLRRQKGLSQDQLAYDLNLSNRQYQTTKRVLPALIWKF
jgi:transcriptional regulator with XRE-family HTH domain